MELPNTIMNQWGGLMISFPAVRNRGDNTYVYKHNQKARAVIATYRVDENWSELPDFMIDEGEFRDLVVMDDLLQAPVVLALEYNDRQVHCRIANFYRERHKLIQDGNAFLPKDRFEMLVKGNE